MSNLTKFKPKQVLCIEAYSLNPNLSYQELANICGVAKPTIVAWMKDPNFVNTIYDKYMEVSGVELPQVIHSMIREAKEGNVQAGRLILEHYGKLENKLKIEIDSPWEKFMKAQNTEFVDVTEVESEEIGSIAPELEEVYDNLPERNESNNSPRKREKEEKGRVVNILKHEKERLKKQQYQKDAYQLRKRAKAVNLELLPNGRQPKGARKEWLRKLEELEKEKEINNT